jgi:hypothetical protein
MRGKSGANPETQQISLMLCWFPAEKPGVCWGQRANSRKRREIVGKRGKQTEKLLKRVLGQCMPAKNAPHMCFLQQDTPDLPDNSVRALANWDESFLYCDGCSPDTLARRAAVAQQLNVTPPVAPQPPTPATAIASTTSSAKPTAQVQHATPTKVSTRAQRAQQKRAKSPKNDRKTHAHQNTSSKTNDLIKPPMRNPHTRQLSSRQGSEKGGRSPQHRAPPLKG